MPQRINTIPNIETSTFISKPTRPTKSKPHFLLSSPQALEDRYTAIKDRWGSSCASCHDVACFYPLNPLPPFPPPTVSNPRRTITMPQRSDNSPDTETSYDTPSNQPANQIEIPFPRSNNTSTPSIPRIPPQRKPTKKSTRSSSLDPPTLHGGNFPNPPSYLCIPSKVRFTVQGKPHKHQAASVIPHPLLPSPE